MTDIGRICGCMRVYPNHACAHAMPHRRARNPSCKCAARREQLSRNDSPVTCAPAGGHQSSSPVHGCLPPPPRGAVGVRGGGVPRPSTPSCAGTSNCRTECTSHSSASSSPAGGVEDIPPHDSCGGIYLQLRRAEVYLQLQQLFMKMLGRERYTQLRKRGQRG